MYPYLAIILAATPNPDPDAAGLLSMIVEAPNVDANGGEATFDVSVREGGGAIAAPPPEEAEKRQFRLVFVRFTTRFDAFFGGKFKYFCGGGEKGGKEKPIWLVLLQQRRQ